MSAFTALLNVPAAPGMPPDMRIPVTVLDPVSAIVFAIIGLVVLFGLAALAWYARASRRTVLTLTCPEHGRPATVVVRLEKTRQASEVERCSLLERGAVRCKRTCLRLVA